METFDIQKDKLFYLNFRYHVPIHVKCVYASMVKYSAGGNNVVRTKPQPQPFLSAFQTLK